MLVGSLDVGAGWCCSAVPSQRWRRAIAQAENRSFVAWNEAFLARSGEG